MLKGAVGIWRQGVADQCAGGHERWQAPRTEDLLCGLSTITRLTGVSGLVTPPGHGLVDLSISLQVNTTPRNFQASQDLIIDLALAAGALLPSQDEGLAEDSQFAEPSGPSRRRSTRSSQPYEQRSKPRGKGKGATQAGGTSADDDV